MYLENNLFYLATSPSISLLSASLTSNSSLLRVKSQNLRNVLERPFKLNEPIKTWRKATCKKENTIQTACDLRWFDLRVFDFMMVWKRMYSAEAIRWILNLGLFLGWRYAVWSSLVMLGSSSKCSSHQPCNQEGKQLITRCMRLSWPTAG